MAKTDIGTLMTELSALVEERQDRMSHYQILRALITVAGAVAGQDDESPIRERSVALRKLATLWSGKRESAGEPHRPRYRAS